MDAIHPIGEGVTVPIGGYETVFDVWAERRQSQMYGYLPGQTALPLPLCLYSSPSPVSVGG